MSSRQLDEEAIFQVARKISDLDARSQYLDQVCSGDRALFARVEALLDVHVREQSFLASNPAAPAPTEDHKPLAERRGMTIGRYKLMEQIGEGGMGVVFVAEQERPIRRKVALKVVKPGMDSKAVIARFEAERQALAMMDHPNIAKVLDAGTTDTGRPYFAMELVKGIPITEYCDKNTLTIRERIGLFIRVCQAIQHAHQKGIIHRDIKPSNVLVTLHDGEPFPKVIDFGVAKALNTRLTDKTIYTEHLQVVGTLLYMSPEQAELSGLDIDTRSDIYALGVLLYELLTGTTPFQQEQLQQAGFDEQRRIIREQEPPRASVRISSLGETATAVAKHRKTDPKKLNHMVQGELDWILLKALEKDRTRRYDSAANLAYDIGRYLNDESVVACPPSAAYRFEKFARRNRGWLLAGMLVGVSLATGTAVALWQWAQARDANRQLKGKVEELRKTNNERTTALEKLQQQLYRRALMAAFLGDEASVTSIRDDARVLLGSSPTWETKINAQLSLFNGKVDQAVQALEQTADSEPDDPGALALLAIACLHSGKHDQYIRKREMLSELKSRIELSDWPPEDQLLVAQAEQFGDIDEGEKSIRAVLNESRSPFALAFHSQALMKQYYGNRDEATREAALDELNAAKLLMPSCAYLATLDLWAHMPLSLDEQISPDRRSRIEGAIKELSQIGSYSNGRHSCACWFDFIGEADLARDEWDAVIGEMDANQGGYIRDYYAAFEYRHGNIDKAKALLQGAVDDSVLAIIHFGEMLALEPDAQSRDAAQRMYDMAAERIEELPLGPDDFIGIPESILVLLGKQEEASQRLSVRLKSSNPTWQEELLRFLADPEREPNELLAAVDPKSYNEVMARKLIALRHLSRGETKPAEEQFEACQQINYSFPDSYWASAYLRRLETDSDWREWLETR